VPRAFALSSKVNIAIITKFVLPDEENNSHTGKINNLIEFEECSDDEKHKLICNLKTKQFDWN
jgi:hypothetical protein